MNSAAFLLAINFSIGLLFGTAFFTIARRTRNSLGIWCAAGFFFAAITTILDLLAPLISPASLGETLPFASFMVAVTLIGAGLAINTQQRGLSVALMLWCIATIGFYATYGYPLPQGGFGHELSFQLPIAVSLAVAASAVFRRRQGSRLRLALAGVLLLCAIQFLGKALLTASVHSDLGQQRYILTDYAFYSQTAGGILSIFLGLALLGVLVSSMVEETKKQFERDSLSGLLTRAAFMRRAGDYLAHNPGAVLILCDLDHFKSINDRYGHAAGDEAIHIFGRALRDFFGKTAPAGRLGGEEFCALLPPLGEDSIGVAIAGHEESLAQLLRRADLALYSAKAAGRDRFHLDSGATGIASMPIPAALPHPVVPEPREAGAAG